MLSTSPNVIFPADNRRYRLPDMKCQSTQTRQNDAQLQTKNKKFNS